MIPDSIQDSLREVNAWNSPAADRLRVIRELAQLIESQPIEDVNDLQGLTVALAGRVDAHAFMVKRVEQRKETK